MQHSRLQVAFAVLRLFLPVAAGCAFLASLYIRFYSGLIPVTDPPAWPIYAGYFVLSLTVWSVLEARAGVIRACLTRPSMWRWAWSLLQLDLLTLAIVSVAAFFWRGYSFSRHTVILFWALHVLLSLAVAWAVRRWLHRQAQGATVWALLIGDSSLDHVRQEYVPQGERIVANWYSTVEAAVAALDSSEPPPNTREVVAVLPPGECHRLGEVAEALERLPLPASVAVEGLPFEDVFATGSFVLFSTGPRAAGDIDYVFAKRLADAALSAAGILLLAPLMLVIASVTWLRSGQPVLISQERVGCGGRRFRLYKFRSLPIASLLSSDRQWAASPIDAWGRFLRRTGLDELPQLFNVLRGQMSLVGPRPERPLFVEQFRKQLPLYSTRHRLQSGITGWAQVNGWRGDTSITRRVEHDLYYLRHWSLGFDLRILWMTLKNFTRHLRESGAGTEGAPHARSV